MSETRSADPYHALILPVTDSGYAVRGRLAGLRYALKDLFDVAGLPTSAGSPDFADWHGLPAQDAWVVRALRECGAELIGKTHLHELAYGITGVNAHHGTPTNPCDAGRIPGGSSSGSAVAVAAGLVAFAIGTDTAGSIRVPASFCGVYGFRPTHGDIPTDGAVALAPSFDSVGVLAKDATVLNSVAEVLCRPTAPAGAARLNGAVVLTDALELADAEGRAAVARIAKRVAGQALDVTEARAGCLDTAQAAQALLQGAEAWAVHEEWITQRQPRLGADVAALLERASRLTPAQLGRASARRAAISHQVERLMAGERLLLLPAAPGPAPLLTDLADAQAALDVRVRLLRLTTLASLAGLPVVAIPAAARDALPVGVQLVGPRGSDPLLLGLARRLEAAAGIG